METSARKFFLHPVFSTTKNSLLFPSLEFLFFSRERQTFLVQDVKDEKLCITVADFNFVLLSSKIFQSIRPTGRLDNERRRISSFLFGNFDGVLDRRYIWYFRSDANDRKTIDPIRREASNAFAVSFSLSPRAEQCLVVTGCNALIKFAI